MALPGVCCLASILSAAAADPKKVPTLKEDLAALQGTWEAAAKAATPLEMTFEKGGLSLEAALPKQKIVAGIPFELKQDGKRRVIEVDAFSAGFSRVPTRVACRLGKDEIVITVADGNLKGEYTLTRQKK